MLDRSYAWDYTAGAPGTADPGPNLDRLAPCLSEKEWNQLFFDLFHESMHSTDSAIQRYVDTIGDKLKRPTRNHTSIHNRTAFERIRPPNSPIPIWGTPRPTPVDGGSLYGEYRRRTPACQCDPNSGEDR